MCTSFWRIPYNVNKVIALPIVVNFPLKYKETMNLKRITILENSIKVEYRKKKIDNKFFWKRDNRREEENSQILARGKKSIGINL